MTKDDAVSLLKGLGKEKEWAVAEFPLGSGMYIFVSLILHREKEKQGGIKE